MSKRRNFNELAKPIDEDSERRERVERIEEVYEALFNLADRVREHEVIRLSNQGADAFVEAITNPKEPGEGLKSLNNRARKAPRSNKGDHSG